MRPILHFQRYFIPNNSTAETHAVAETALWINGISLIPDALRIISGNLLNTFDKILFPNIVSLISMTLVGIPTAYLAALKNKNDLFMIMFAVRAAMIFCAAVINTIVLYQEIAADKKEVGNVVNGSRDDTIRASSPADAAEETRATGIAVFLGKYGIYSTTRTGETPAAIGTLKNDAIAASLVSSR